jgi:hypothetical protein
MSTFFRDGNNSYSVEHFCCNLYGDLGMPSRLKGVVDFNQ